MKYFKKPVEYKVRAEKTQVSARVDMADKETLEAAAKKANMTLSELLAGLIHDYCKYLKGEK